MFMFQSPEWTFSRMLSLWRAWRGAPGMAREEVVRELGEEEERRSYTGRVTEVAGEQLVVDEALVVAATAAADGRVAVVGDTVTLALGRRGEGAWCVRELVQVCSEEWGQEGGGEVVARSGEGTQVCGTVEEVRRGEVRVSLPGGRSLAFPLAVWREAHLPRAGDLATLTLRLPGRDLEEVEEGTVEAAAAARSMETDCVVEYWRGGGGVASGEVFLPRSCLGPGWTPRRGESVRVQVPPTLPSTRWPGGGGGPPARGAPLHLAGCPRCSPCCWQVPAPAPGAHAVPQEEGGTCSQHPRGLGGAWPGQEETRSSLFRPEQAQGVPPAIRPGQVATTTSHPF